MPDAFGDDWCYLLTAACPPTACCLGDDTGNVCLSAELLGPAFDPGSGTAANISHVPVGDSGTFLVALKFSGSFTACGKKVCYEFQISFGFLCVEGGVAAVRLDSPLGGREFADCIGFGMTFSGVEGSIQGPTLPCDGTGVNSYTFAIPMVADVPDGEHPLACDLGTLSVRLTTSRDTCAVPAAPTIDYDAPGGGPTVFSPGIIGPTDCDCSPPTGLFNCSSGTCIEAGGGTYATLDGCLSACLTTPPPSGLGAVDGDNPGNIITPCCSKMGIGIGVGRSITASVLSLGGCACLNGSFGLAWSPGFGGWYGSTVACGGFFSLFLYCTDAGYRIRGWFNGVQVFDRSAPVAMGDSDCSPLNFNVSTGVFSLSGVDCSLAINLSDGGGA